MQNPFWNGKEHRVRSLWRLIVQILLFLILVLGLGIVLAAGVLVTTVAQGGSATDAAAIQGLFQSLMAEPVLYLVMQVGQFAALVLSLLIAGAVLDRRRLADFGFHLSRRWWSDLAFGLALGALLMLGIFVVELAFGWVTIATSFQVARGDFTVAIGMALIGFIGVGIQEEWLSRGYQLRNIAEGLNWTRIGPRNALVAGYVLSSVVFGSLHLANPNTTAMSTINLVAAGLFLGLGYLLTGELAISIGLHITWNFFQGNVFGFPVSGLPMGTSFLAIRQGGPDVITGGAFGPEAGLIGLIAMVVGSVLVVLWVHKTRGAVRLLESLAQYTRRAAAPAAGESPSTDAAAVG